MSNTRGIGPVPESFSEDQATFLEQVRSFLRTLEADRRTGSGFFAGGGGVGGGAVTAGPPGPPGPPGGDPEPDLTPPPTPSDLVVEGGLGQVFITWSGITYTQGRGNKQTLIYIARRLVTDPTNPTFNENLLYATAPHALTVASVPIEPNTRVHVWLKFETNDGVRSVTPAGGANGVVATTGQDVSRLLEILVGDITESQLAAALSTRINLIDGNAAGSVNQRIQAETTARTTALAQEADARALADTVLGGRNDALAAAQGQQGAALAVEQQTRSGGDTALSQQTTTLTAAVGATAAGLVVEQVARADADTANASQTLSLGAAVAGNAAGLVLEQQTRADADVATAGQIMTLGAAAGSSAAALQVEQQARADADTASAAQTTTLSAATGANVAALQVELQVRTDGDTSLAQQASTLVAQAGANSAGLFVEQVARADADAASASQVSGLAAAAGATAAGLLTEVTVRANGDTALGSRVDSLAAAAGTNAAAIVAEQTVRANQDSAVASQITTLSAAVGTNTADLQTEATVRANADGALQAQYTVKVDVNGYVSGFGLASTLNNATPFSDFAIRADRFYIANPSGPGVSPEMPFIVLTTPGTAPDGSTIPVGVYMRDTFIQNGTITNAKIRNATITNAKIADLNVAKLTGGSMQVGSFIQSTNYVSGPSGAGWRINADGTAELQAAYIRGTLAAGNFAINSITGDKLAVNSITAKHIAVTDLENLCTNGRGASTDGWSVNGSGSINAYPTAFPFWPSAYGSQSALEMWARDHYFGQPIPVRAGDSFLLVWDSIPFGGAAMNFDCRLGFAFYSAAGSVIAWSSTDGAVRPAALTGAQRISGFITVPATLSGQTVAAVQIWAQIDKPAGNSSNAAGDGIYATNIVVRRRNGSELIVDGAVTTNKLTVGARGLPSIVPNADFTDWTGTNSGIAALRGWVLWSPPPGGGTVGRNFNEGRGWNLGRGGAFFTDPFVAVGVTTNSWGIMSAPFPVNGNSLYEIHAKGSVHRCTHRALVEFYNGAGANVGTTLLWELAAGSGIVGGSFSALSPLGWAQVTSASTAATARLLFLKSPGQVTASDSYVFVQEVYMNLLQDGASATNPTRFRGSDVVEIHGGGIVAKTITVDQLADNAVGITQITPTLASTNFNGTVDGAGNITANGTAGWVLTRSGNALFNNVRVRGDVQANSVTANSVTTLGIAVENATIQRFGIAAGNDCTVTLTIPSGIGTVPVFVLGTVVNRTNSRNQILYVNGTEVRNETAVSGTTVTLTWKVDLSPGTHTFRMLNTDAIATNASVLVLANLR